ncbi:Protein N-acetyltransferase, RimJ/RimL family [Amycolatopsis xylanica]|uniref:Protein N-acetyltransferase, RimJ/RimL family n=1 Tax=Amycolatopsis xylanica TaxID=589385 RepID=A0A1H3T9Q5_9PSEU|nr:GNAT family N-acetyltransferase [Amycolatopsis xylanica]SDZ46445.1 Protein N-acetyltransferase, RimJ/RimL family [Amycolatopsis xylanica]
MPDRFPETTLRTERLILRPFGGADIEDVQRGCADEATQRWIPLTTPYTLADAGSWCTTRAHALRESGDGIHFAVVDAGTDRLLANVGLRHTDWETSTTEIGYWVSPWARGRGHAAEAVRIVAGWVLGEQRFERLELKAADGNAASQRVAVKAGFQREGLLRNAGVTHTGRVDLVLFARVRQDLGGS